MKLFDLINPVKIMALFTLYGGGSGGGSAPSNPDTRYANLDSLYGTQNQASQFMLNNAMPQVPYTTDNSRRMVDQAFDGTMGRQLREQAGNESQATFGAAMDANNRNMQRYGMGLNANRIRSENNRNAIMAAGAKAGTMNKADMFAEDQKWNRNANFYGQVMGMNSGAQQGMSSAGAGLTSIANQQSSNDAKNAAGYGQAGSAFASSLFKAEGGYIEGEKPVRLAEGGDAWTAYKLANPVKPMSSGSSGGRRTNPYSAMLGGAAPQLLGAGLKDVLNIDGKGGNLAKWGNKGLSAVKDYQAAQAAKEYAESAQTINEAREAAELAANANDAAAIGTGLDAASTVSTGVDVADTINSGVVAADAASAAADAASAGAGAVDAASWGGTAADTFAYGGSFLANGGHVKKKGKKFALGGLANNSVTQNNKADGDAATANMDATSSMIVAKMDDPVTQGKVTHAKPTGNVSGNYANTDGMGEGSYGDEDGFGVHSGDNRHLAGSTTLSAVGYMFGIPGLGLLAKPLHPIGQEVSRQAVRQGDKVGGVSGAMLMDPVATSVSGKYSNEELIKGRLLRDMGMPWAGKLLADGGDVKRTDMKAGGDVQGPGTETSDDIPAWLSDGEYVLNAEAVKMVGKEKLDKINVAGLQSRRKEGVKLAGGGFLGGNMGIALGAGVDEMNRQRTLDRMDQTAGLAVNADRRAQEDQDLQVKAIQEKKTKDAAAQKVWTSAMPAINGGKESRVKYLQELYNSNSAAAGYNDGQMADVEITPTGARATLKKADGTPVGIKEFTDEQIHSETVNSIYGQLAGVDKEYGDKFIALINKPYDAKAAREARVADYAAKSHEAAALERVKGEERIKLEKERTAGRVEVNAAKPVGLASRGGGAGGDSSKGAKFDVDSDGNRVILYRNGTMVYPKDGNGAPVKIKAGTDLDQKFTRDMTKIYEKANPSMPEDPVARAQELATRTKTGAPAAPQQPAGLPTGAKQIGTSGGKPVFQSPDGKKFIVD